MGLALSPLLSHQTKTGTAKHPPEGSSHATYTIARQKAQVCRHDPEKQSRKSGYRGGPRGGGQTQVPPPVAKNSLANFRGASEFAFAFAAVSLRPRCPQFPSCNGFPNSSLNHVPPPPTIGPLDWNTLTQRLVRKSMA